VLTLPPDDGFSGELGFGFGSGAGAAAGAGSGGGGEGDASGWEVVWDS